jgi:ABC-type proline/glycine betaine transport system permease subunit
MDVVWTSCVNAVTSRRPLTAANYSALLYFCTIVSTVLIVEKCFAAVAAYIAGGWLGTYIVVSYRGQRPSNPRQQ